MRKLTSIVVALLLVFALAACGSSDSAVSNSSGETSQATSNNHSVLNLSLEAEETTKDGKAYFIINTNLPDETELILTLSQASSNYRAQGKVTIAGGTATSEAFSDHDAPLSGDYTLEVTMSLPKLQSDSVRAVIGEKGEYLTGQYVNEEDGTIRAQFDCSFDAANEEQKTEEKQAESQPETKEDQAPEQAASVASSNANQSSEQSGAVRKAQDYLSFTAFSHDSLVEQLEFEGYSHDDAVYGADNCGADWREQAQKKASEYFNTSAFSQSGLVEQLEFEKFSSDDAEYAAENCGADWNEQAAKKAQQYRDLREFSHSELVEQLEFEGFTSEQAEYGAAATE